MFHLPTRLLLAVTVVGALLFTANVAQAQSFDLVQPGAASKTAELFADRLVITDAAGNVTTFPRDARYDAPGYIGYLNTTFDQSVRWPVTNSGAFQIGTQRGGFKQATMRIQAKAAVIGPGGEVTMSVKNHTTKTLSIYWADSTTGKLIKYFDIRSGEVLKQDTVIDHFWQAVDATGRTEATFKVPRLAGPTWDIGTPPVAVPTPPTPGIIPPVPTPVPVPIVPSVPVRTLVSSKAFPNEALAPVEVEMSNDQTKELWVLVFNRETETGQRVKIPAGQSKTLKFERDPGAKILETYDVRDPRTGVVERQQVVNEVAPQVLYDISVYEMVVQSVYIDRTRPGAPREETRVPSSVGWFEVPAGDKLVAGKSPVYTAAKNRKNAGDVRNINPAEWETEGTSSSTAEPTRDPFSP